MEVDQGIRGWRGWRPAFLWLAIAAMTAALAAPWTAAAQDLGPDQGQHARAVRLSYVDGDVQVAEDGQVTAEHAVVNTPLLQGTTVTTGDAGRAEIQFEDGSIARLAPNSALTLKVLAGDGSSGSAEMEVEHGLAYFELQGTGQDGTTTVDFGNTQVIPSGFTVLRVSYDTPPGELAVFAGNAGLDRDNGTLTLGLHAGENLALSPNDQSEYQLSENIPPDSWDTWNTDRDQELAAEAQQPTAPASVGANPSNPAWNDLDANGTWYDVPDQGYVWSPYEAANSGWDPYGDGNWVFTIGYGYTWASAYPWGYLPYSCGAWNFYNGFGWGWAPGFGGCTPWWGAGYYGGPAIGRRPLGYRPVHRPIAPSRPVRGRPVPLVAVNRMQTPGHTADLPLRNRTTPVSISGHRVQPMRPIPLDSSFGRSAYMGSGSIGAPPLGAAGTPIGAIGVPPGLNLPGRPGYAPARPGFARTPQPVIGNRFPPRGSYGIEPGRAFAPPIAGRPAGGFPAGNPGGFHPAPGAPHGPPAGGGFHGGGGGGGGFHGGGASHGGGAAGGGSR